MRQILNKSLKSLIKVILCAAVITYLFRKDASKGRELWCWISVLWGFLNSNLSKSKETGQNQGHLVSNQSKRQYPLTKVSDKSVELTLGC